MKNSPSPSLFTVTILKKTQTSTKFINIIKTGTWRPMTTIKLSTLLPQCGTLGGVLLLLLVLPLEQKSHSTILIAPAPGLQKIDVSW
jgi:hypothetical protein